MNHYKVLSRCQKKTQGLKADDIANAILFAVQSPEHMNVNEILVRPTTQRTLKNSKTIRQFNNFTIRALKQGSWSSLV